VEGKKITDEGEVVSVSETGSFFITTASTLTATAPREHPIVLTTTADTSPRRYQHSSAINTMSKRDHKRKVSGAIAFPSKFGDVRVAS